MNVLTRTVRSVPDYRDLFELLQLNAAARLAQESKPGSKAISAIARAAGDELENADLYFATRDLVDAARIMSSDAPTLPAGNACGRFVLFAEPLSLGMESAMDYSAATGFSEGATKEMPVDIIGLIQVPRPEIFNDAGDAFAEDFYAALLLVPEGEAKYPGDARAAMLFSRNELHDMARLVFWIIENPDLMSKTVTDVAPRQSKAARRRSKPHAPRLVTVVDLRASHKKAAADVEAAERTYRHRWIVRGHWHRYRVGKGRTEERLNYVMPYVKGPAGAPLNATERVFQW